MLDYVSHKQKESRDFSVRKWAREMGLSSNALLVMLLQGKRPLRVKHATFLSKGLHFTAQESLYFQAMLQYDSALDPEEKKLCSLWLSELSPGKNFKIKEMDSYIAISHWIYTTLLAMTELREFTFTEEKIFKRLNKKATRTDIRAAVERLFSLGLLTRTPDGKIKSTFERVTTKPDLKDAGVIEYHEASSQLAKEMVSKLPPEKKEYQAFSLCIDSKKIPQAKEMLRKFRAQLVKAIGSEQGDEVVQINLQLFQLTESQASDKAKDEGVDTETNQKSFKRSNLC